MRNPAFLLILCSSAAIAQTAAQTGESLSANEIMRRVAENQDRAQKERTGYVYEERVHVATHYSNGKLAREERSAYIVAPTPTGAEKTRKSISGRYWEKGKYIEFNDEPLNEKDGIDAGLTSSFRDDLIKEKSKDGAASHLFPLSTERQKDLRFDLAGEQIVDGRKAYKVRFGPEDKNDYTWAGEALIDAEEFQPVSVWTKLSRKLPLFVRTVLGTDVPGVGFTTRYKRVAKDIWFPVTFGTEFKLHAVFFINRTITVSMESKNFQKASADTRISYEGDPVQ